MFELADNTPPDKKIRATHVQQGFVTLLGRDPSLSPLGAFSKPPKNNQWEFLFGSRNVTVSLPEYAADGAYNVAISGSPLVAIKNNIDKYSRQFRFHRISSNDEALLFTIEWAGDGGLEDAYSLIYFVNTLKMVLNTLPN